VLARQKQHVHRKSANLFVVVIGCCALDGVSHARHTNKIMISPAKSREKFLYVILPPKILDIDYSEQLIPCPSLSINFVSPGHKLAMLEHWCGDEHPIAYTYLPMAVQYFFPMPVIDFSYDGWAEFHWSSFLESR